MMAPCDRLSTPETPKMSVKPVAPRAYKALTAKPSIRICNASIQFGRGSTAALMVKNGGLKNAPGGNRSGSTVASSIRSELDKARELQLGLGNFRRPNGDLLAVLPLQHQACDQALAVFDSMGERLVLAVELHAADGADPVGLFQRLDQLVCISRTSALDGV